MTTLIRNSATLPSPALGFRLWLGRLGRLIDSAVSARAGRAVPEWQMRQVEAEIRRHLRRTTVRQRSGSRSD